MKHFKIISLLAVMFFVSCSLEDQTSDELERTVNQKSGLTRTEVDILKQKFDYIVTTQNWQDRITAVRAFNRSLKVPVSGFETRNEFEVWLRSNLHLTSFSNTDVALNAFDNITLKIRAVEEANIDFYNSIGNASSDDLIIIFESMTPPVTTYEATPCQNACMDACDITLNNMEAGYALGTILVQQGDLSQEILDAAYWNTYDGAVYTLNECMWACDDAG
jgi:hypothetical protein